MIATIAEQSYSVRIDEDIPDTISWECMGPQELIYHVLDRSVTRLIYHLLLYLIDPVSKPRPITI